MSGANSIDDLLSDPHRYGFCTFEEFRRNKEKWLGRADDEISSVDAGDRNLQCRNVYYLESDAGRYRVDSLEQAERIALDMGLNLFHDFLIKPQVREDISARNYIEVTFLAKQLIAKRANW